MDSFHQNETDARLQGTIIRTEVAIPCWSRKPADRPSMKTVEEILEAILDRPGS